MPPDAVVGLITGALTTGEWIVAIASALLLLLTTAPVIWLCCRFVAMSDDAMAKEVADIQRFVEQRDRFRR
jgi:uncharacterized membrane protein YfbV (UPF0208 family)